MIHHVGRFVAQVVNLCVVALVVHNVLRRKRSLMGLFGDLLQKCIDITRKQTMRVAFIARIAALMDGMRQRFQRSANLALRRSAVIGKIRFGIGHRLLPFNFLRVSE